MRLVFCLVSALSLSGQTVDFNRDVRPIFSDKCFTCHGPDQANRKSKLRLDTEDGAKADLGGRFGIIPGHPDKSEVFRRISTPNRAQQMPPAWAGAAKLSDNEIATIQRWIEQGAKWQAHWSLIPPARPELPKVSAADWPRNAIDHFVAARLEREGLRPSPEADRRTLIRRVSFDLTGLPPTPAEVEAFVQDQSPDAYEKVVDRLLASPRYGERMAIRWLDAARYADTNGYQSDAERFMWRWRDWVIEAFNNNMPFDRFTVEQLAGDLLPNPTLEQRIATGFNRNHRGNGEGGIIPEEYAVEYVVDRVDTTSTVWLGLTLGCSRCHDHKYDPFSQKEFYQLYAFFNNIPELGRAFKYGNSPPFIPAPTREEQKKLDEVNRRLQAAEQRWNGLAKELNSAQDGWEKKLGNEKIEDWTITDGLTHTFSFDDARTKVKDGEESFTAGRSGRAAVLDGKRFYEGEKPPNAGFYSRFSVSVWISPEAAAGPILTRTLLEPEAQGWGIYLANGRVQVNLVQRWLDDALRTETEAPVSLSQWHHVLVTYDGTRMATGLKIYVDGREAKQKVLLDELNQDFRSNEPLRIGAGGPPDSRFKGAIDEVKFYSRVLGAKEAEMLADTRPVWAIAGTGERSEAAASRLRLCYLERYAPAHIRDAWQHLTAVRKEKEALVNSFSTVMVMQERPEPRDAFILTRGAYDRPGAKVSRAVPAALHPLPEGAPLNRLGLAQWIVDPRNPLTSRVTVNRFWQMLFGTGIVKTTEDFGSQGEWPTHPELLDWLATEFVRTGWNVKGLMKTIAMSATYRQSSKTIPEMLQRDPENRLLARGARFRLPAEAIRDQALAVSGLLVEKLGGPSVKPYQPAGLWKELGNADYEQDHGEKLYRRSMYTFWKRAVAPPMMMTFDSALRETCIVRENRTNTPLQALNLMNDVTYVEAARAMAQRMWREGGSTADDRIAYGFLLATARHPSPKERQVLKTSLQHYRDAYQTRTSDAAEVVRLGESKPDGSIPAPELAAYTALASLILNLDEVLTKE